MSIKIFLSFKISEFCQPMRCSDNISGTDERAAAEMRSTTVWQFLKVSKNKRNYRFYSKKRNLITENFPNFELLFSGRKLNDADALPQRDVLINNYLYRNSGKLLPWNSRRCYIAKPEIKHFSSHTAHTPTSAKQSAQILTRRRFDWRAWKNYLGQKLAIYIYRESF